MNRTSSADSRALSLVEVAASLVILSLLLGGALAISAQGYTAMKTSRERIVAHNLARELMEQYSDWSELVLLTGGDPPANGVYANPPAPVTRNMVVYTPQVTVADGPLAAARLKMIEVMITWPDGTALLRTFKSNY